MIQLGWLILVSCFCSFKDPKNRIGAIGHQQPNRQDRGDPPLRHFTKSNHKKGTIAGWSHTEHMESSLPVRWGLLGRVTSNAPSEVLISFTEKCVSCAMLMWFYGDPVNRVWNRAVYVSVGPPSCSQTADLIMKYTIWTRVLLSNSKCVAVATLVQECVICAIWMWSYWGHVMSKWQRKVLTIHTVGLFVYLRDHSCSQWSAGLQQLCPFL